MWTAAAEVADVGAVAPDLIWLEVGNALAGYVRTGHIAVSHGRRALSALLDLPFRTVPAAQLVEASFAVALERSLTVHDAWYAALAEAENATLVTADRTLARAVPGSELLI